MWRSGENVTRRLPLSPRLLPQSPTLETLYRRWWQLEASIQDLTRLQGLLHFVARPHQAVQDKQPCRWQLPNDLSMQSSRDRETSHRS